MLKFPSQKTVVPFAHRSNLILTAFCGQVAIIGLMRLNHRAEGTDIALSSSRARSGYGLQPRAKAVYRAQNLVMVGYREYSAMAMSSPDPTGLLRIAGQPQLPPGLLSPTKLLANTDL